MKLYFKLINESDVEILREIYNYYVQNTTVTFQSNPVDIDYIRKNYPLNSKQYKTFLIIHEGYAVGYCALEPYKKKKAYNRTAEICIYLKPENIDKGIGARAVRYIEKTARENGIKILLAFITAENEPSVRLFKKLGYYQCAHFKKIGEKFNRVLDVLVYQKEI